MRLPSLRLAYVFVAKEKGPQRCEALRTKVRNSTFNSSILTWAALAFNLPF
jgi:hypothetical protein